MRKTLLLSALVAGVLGIVAVAYAANTYKVDTAKVTPTKSGTVSSPKPESILFGYSVGSTDGNRPNVTTDYVINFGPGIQSNNKLKNGSKPAFAQCTRAQASANACASNTKLGAGVVKNLAGLASDKTQKIPCQLNLTIHNGDGKLFPPAQNDGKAVKEDVWLSLKGQPPICPLVVNAPLPAQLIKIGGGTALAFHVTKIPFQQPQGGVENAVINVSSTLARTARVGTKTRGYFESTKCPKVSGRNGRPIKVTYTDTSGAKFNATKVAPCSP